MSSFHTVLSIPVDCIHSVAATTKWCNVSVQKGVGTCEVCLLPMMEIKAQRTSSEVPHVAHTYTTTPTRTCTHTHTQCSFLFTHTGTHIHTHTLSLIYLPYIVFCCRFTWIISFLMLKLLPSTSTSFSLTIR